MNYRTYTNDELITAVKSSVTKREVLRKLNLSETGGGSYRTIQRLIKELSLDTSHFTGMAWSKGTKRGPTRPVQDYLFNGSSIKSNDLKHRLLSAGLLEHKCQSCGLVEWLNKPIPIELDHINGIYNDNRLENLRILCNNCHAFTPTWRGRANKNKLSHDRSHNKSEKMNKLSVIKRCPDCSIQIYRRSIRCKKCDQRIRPISYKLNITNEELHNRIIIHRESILSIAKSYGVSGNAVRKRCKRFNIPFKKSDILDYINGVGKRT